MIELKEIQHFNNLGKDSIVKQYCYSGMNTEYDPFLYPPNYELAHLHKNASMPGTSVSPPRVCPCCNKKERQPYKEWINRNIDSDFRNFGGSVVTYFWLLKLYICAVAVIVIVYSIYLTFLIRQNCTEQNEDCQKMFGIWVISNQSLIKILKGNKQDTTVVRLLTLRGTTFVILMLTNALSLIFVRKFKQIHPNKASIADYSVIFKNANLQTEDFILKLRQQFPQIQIKEIQKLFSIEPFYTYYQQKMQKYYESLIPLQLPQKPKQIKKRQRLLQQLAKFNSLCAQSEEQYYSQKGQRIIVTLQTIQQKNTVLEAYKRSKLQKLKSIFSHNDKIYCAPAPRPEQVIWHNIGSGDKHKAKYRFLSILYFFILLACAYLVLSLCMNMVYEQWFNQPLNTIVINVILIFVVYMGLTFRQFMNKFSELSHPSTYTNRTMFIVLTTVSFHLLFYVIIPTSYFAGSQSEEHKNLILKMISNQVFNFVLFQFIIVGVDLMHCCWNRKLKIIQNQEKPFACQYILHKNIQYPRFPIEFKLIILFKLWSFTMFFSFQSPFVLLLILAMLIFLFFKDKHSIYFHYRMQVIDNKVQFKFLRIYTVFFSVYGFIVFVLTQHLQIQFWMAAAFTAMMVMIQFFWLGNEKNFQKNEIQLVDRDSLLIPPSFDELEHKQSYRKIYQQFMSKIKSDATDIKVKQYLGVQSLKSLNTQE